MSLGALAVAQLIVGGAGALVGVLAVAAVIRTVRALDRLDAVTPRVPDDGWPEIAVVVPASNEAATLPATLKALLAVDYPALRVWWSMIGRPITPLPSSLAGLRRSLA